MGKHKHFHDVRDSRKFLDHARREGLGPARSKFPPKKKAAPGAANTQDGEGTKHSS